MSNAHPHRGRQAALAALAIAAPMALVVGGSAATAQVGPVFTEAYRLVDTWTSREPSSAVPRMTDPRGVDVSPDGAVFVVDRGPGVILQLDGSGLVADRWPARPGTGMLLDVAASSDRVFVIGTGRLEVRSRDGSVVAEVDMPGATGVAAGSDGRAYVVRRTGFDLQAETVVEVVDRDGRSLDAWPASPFVIVSPQGLCVGPGERVFLAADGAVYVFEAGRVAGGLRLPEGIEGGEVLDVDTDELGRLYATQGSTTSRRIIVWDIATAAASGAQVFPGATALAVGPGGGLVVSTRVASGFVGLSFVADRSDLAAPPLLWGETDRSLGRLTGPRRLAASPAGSVFLLDSAHGLQRWSAAGDPLEQWPATSGAYRVDVLGGAETPCVVEPRTIRCLGGGGAATWTVTPAAESWLSAADGGPDTVIAVDLAEQRTWVLDRDGNRLGGWPIAPAGGFVVAPDVAVGSDTAFTIDRNRETVLVTDLAGDARDPAEIPVRGGATRIAARDDRLYALTDDGWLWKFATDGRALTAWQPAPDGRSEDLAIGPGGRVYVADSANDRILVFEPGGTPSEVPPEPEPDRCAVAVDKRASPAEMFVGDAIEVRLTVKGSCPEGDGRIDVVLVVDQSGSMAGTPLVSAQSAAVTFLGFLAPGRAQVAVVGFSTTATVLQPLTADMRSVVRAIGRLSPGGQTVYTEALEAARAELIGPRGRDDVPQIVVMLSDGKPTDRTQVLRAAADLKSLGISIYTVGLGSDVDAALLGAIASELEQYYGAPTESDLSDVYSSIARKITAGQLLTSGTVTDVVPVGMTYVHGSSIPPAQVTGKQLRWNLADVATTGAILRYDLRPWRPGRQPTNESAVLEYVDGAGQDGRLEFPVPEVNVLARSRWQAFLPQVWKRTCKPQRADVVLVFDTSSSMTGPAGGDGTQTKLDAALSAARTFVGMMQLPDDQAAIVTFDSAGRRVQPLTGSRAEIELALATIDANQGTRIDKGLELALAELLGSRHRERNNPVIVLLSDGLPERGSERRTLEIALDARAAGIELFTIGLGQDADADLLWLLAGDSSRTFEAPEASELRTIYSQIAGRVLCY